MDIFEALMWGGMDSSRGELRVEEEIKREEMENITASEIAGLGVGTLLFCATIAAPKVDAFISASQRVSLGMCKKCGDMKVIACSRCKGAGMVRSGALNFSLMDDIFPSLGDQKTNAQSISCSNCQGRGHIYCSDCSKRK